MPERRSKNTRRRNAAGQRRGQRGRDQRGNQSNHGNQGGQRRKASAIDAPRQVALDVLGAVRTDGAYANLTLPKELRARNITGRDAAFATELTYGTLRAQGLLDAVLAEASTRPLDQIDPEVLDVLRLGAYQLLRTRVGAHAAVDTSVRAVIGAGKVGAKGFVNAILRTVSRKTEEEWAAEVAPDAGRDPVGHLALKHGHPRWIADAFAQALGSRAGELADALAADDARPIVHLVAKPGEISAEELALITGGEEGPWSPYCVRLESGDPGDLAPVKERLAAVQDEGSQLIARAVTMAPLDGDDGGRWLDLCAGPGGKAAFLGGIAAIEGATVDAVEPVKKRAGLVENSVRGLPVTVHVADGRDPGLEPGYDRILVDAPCSGLGSLRRRPEARWRKSTDDLPALTKLQGELLESAAKLARPGGIIVYSTCSPHLRETRGAIDRAVRRLGLEELDGRALVEPMGDVGDGPSVQMWPHRHGTDAMFFAVLRKPA
ncbi:MULTISPECIES: RsmB/NOP family class I SAM-dependent RNA methyltransferase [Corynebacterium]|uniref:RsmB/NOP family class I SAM-dependent RNA methyltransferase n=1 Tax=Corynebacterium TaxID=1716 RepID=UPI0008A35C06|nr:MULTISPECIES: transcription antitermination factor NusB [Corynebacterium]OFU53566.1 methyltransferase [Corynebacterium sp. HMSC11E11]UBI01255.1 rRNA small subunit methyltransferase B [Corynebacterium freneyi]